MSTQTQTAPATKVVTGLVRLSYLHVWEPKAIEEGQPKKYSASIIIPKSDKATLDKIKAAIKAATEEGKEKFGGKTPPNMKLPFRDGDVERPDDEAYVGAYFINANSTQQPGIVDRDRNDILDKEEVYSGIYGRVSINFYAFNTSGNKGIAAGLNHIQKIKDGPALSGRTSAEEDFSEDFVDDDLL